MTPHRHLRTEIMYVVSGECTVHLTDEQVRMQEGGFILVDAGVPHSLHVPAGAPCRMMNLEFVFEPGADLLSPSTAAAAMPALRAFLSPPRPFRLLTDAEDLHMRIRTLLDVLDVRVPAGTAELELQFLGLLVSAARRFAEDAPSGGASAEGTGLVPVHVRRALLFLRENYDRDVGLRETAEAVGVSAGHLARVFRQSTGESVGECLSRIRMDRACRLLADSDHPVGTIAGMVGFDSRHYFNEFFRAHGGVAPGAYRARVRNRAGGPDADPLASHF
jgi:AraC-like DNA-binding protein